MEQWIQLLQLFQLLCLGARKIKASLSWTSLLLCQWAWTALKGSRSDQLFAASQIFSYGPYLQFFLFINSLICDMSIAGPNRDASSNFFFGFKTALCLSLTLKDKYAADHANRVLHTRPSSASVHTQADSLQVTFIAKTVVSGKPRAN